MLMMPLPLRTQSWRARKSTAIEASAFHPKVGRSESASHCLKSDVERTRETLDETVRFYVWTWVKLSMEDVDKLFGRH